MSATYDYSAALEKYKRRERWDEPTTFAINQIAPRRWNQSEMMTAEERAQPEIWFSVYIALSEVSRRYGGREGWINGFSRKTELFEEIERLAQQKNIPLSVLDKKCLCYMTWTCSSIQKAAHKKNGALALVRLMGNHTSQEGLDWLGHDKATFVKQYPEWLPKHFETFYLSEEFSSKLNRYFAPAYIRLHEATNSKSKAHPQQTKSKSSTIPPLSENTCCLYRIDSLAYEKDFPRQEAFENVVTAFNRQPCRLVYYLKGSQKGVSFYVGVTIDENKHEDPSNQIKDSSNIIEDYANIFENVFKGNFHGSKLTRVRYDLPIILKEIQNKNLDFQHIVGVPANNKDKDALVFQGVERLVNAMSNCDEDFHLVVVWEPIDGELLSDYEVKCYKLYSELAKKAQTSLSTELPTDNSIHDTLDKLPLNNSSRDEIRKSKSSSKNITIIDKASAVCADRLDKIILPRIQHGKAKGMYRTAVYVGASSSPVREQLANTLISICQGDSPIPLKSQPGGELHSLASSFRIDRTPLSNEDKGDLRELAYVLNSRPPLEKVGQDDDGIPLGTWLTSYEVSILAGLPQKEVPGLELRERVEFGLNVSSPKVGGLEIGPLYQDGLLLKHHRAYLDKAALSKHIFITGTTGSGKTTTCHRLLKAAEDVPFMVLEPAKTEYRALLASSSFKNLVIFTAGDERGVPFRFNPFEFLEDESISGHIDLLKACFMASFDMDAAIPNLLEEGLYAVYKKMGWDFRTNENRYLEDRSEAWRSGGRYFPTLSLYIDTVLELVDEKGFDTRLRDDYKGSILARLDSLRAGVKGAMFDTPLSVDFMDLMDKNVILEMEEVKSPESKSFLMALILGRLVECLKAKHKKNKNFRHVTLIEEAHRLLSRPQSGDSQNRRQGVEIFTDLLAEVRKYGESFIIVDQIPAKLTPEVLKNTNTKIIHKIFARDDKDAVGDTMALDDSQKNYLSQLDAGDAVIFSQGWKKPIHVHVTQLTDAKTSDGDIEDEKVQAPGYSYWLKNAHIFCPFLSECNLKRVSSWRELKRLEAFSYEIASALKDLQRPPYDLIRSYEKVFGDNTKDYLAALLVFMALKKHPEDKEVRKFFKSGRFEQRLLTPAPSLDEKKSWNSLQLRLSAFI